MGDALQELELQSGVEKHAEKEAAVAPAVDVCFTITAVTVSDGDIADFEIQFGGSKKQVEVAEGIELAKVGAVLGDAIVSFAGKNLGSAEGVFHGLAEQPTECDGKEFVRAEVEKPHGLSFHRVNQPHPIGELGLSRDQGLAELRQILGRHSEVGVKNYQNIACGFLEADTHGIALAFSRLLEGLDSDVGIGFLDSQNLIPSVVAGATLDENYFGIGPEIR